MKSAKKLLMIMDYAPDYRESFLEELGKQYDLHVYGQPCERNYLMPPLTRHGYVYHEYRCFSLFAFRFHFGLSKIVNSSDWDIICANFNLRQPSRIWVFLRSADLRNKWFWRGRIIGRSDKFRLAQCLKKFILGKARACLVYNEIDANFSRRKYHPTTISFNNSEVSIREFREPNFSRSERMKLLFVGRNQPRKKLERLVRLAGRNPMVSVRIIGPNCEKLNEYKERHGISGSVEFLGRTVGSDLNPHFDWADLVINPGHVGLLVMNAARHGKPIMIDSGSTHAPEYLLAVQAKQIFVDCSSEDCLDEAIKKLHADYEDLRSLGMDLQRLAKKSFTVEHMARVHAEAFEAENWPQ